MKTTKKTFGKYEIKVVNGLVSIIYVWSAKDKEVFKENLTPVDALTLIRDRYIRKGENAYYPEVKAFLWPYIEQEF